jgi:hypothetical protein
MPSLEMARTRKLLEKGVIGQVSDTTYPTLFILKYIGTGSVTSVIVTTATDITTTTTEGVKTYTWAAYTTVGALIDAINADGIFEAKILDCLSTTPTGAGLTVAGTLAVDVNGNYKVQSNTANALFLAYRLCYDRGFGSPAKLINGHRVHVLEIDTTLTLAGGADANALKVYEVYPAGNSSFVPGVENLVYQVTPTTGSAATINWADGQGKITSGEGADLLVIVTDATGITGTLTVVGIKE